MIIAVPKLGFMVSYDGYEFYGFDLKYSFSIEIDHI